MTKVVRGAWASLALATLALLTVMGTVSTGGPQPDGPKPTGPKKDQDKQIVDTLKEVANKGAFLFNERQDYAGCYRLYEGALLAVKPQLAGRPELQKAIDAGLGQAALTPSFVDKAFIARKVIDQIRDTLRGGEKQPPDGKDKDFKISAGGLVKLKQGDKKDVKIEVKRGKDLKGNIEVELKADKGLSVTPQKTTLDPTTSGFVATVSVAKNAPMGKLEIAIVGKGDGKTVLGSIPIEVEKGVEPPPKKDDDFKIKVGNAIKLKAGQKSDLVVSVKRGKDFNDKIVVELKAGKGLTVTPAKQELAPGMNDAKFSVAAAKDADGKSEIQITATGGGKTHKAKVGADIEKGMVEPPPKKEDDFKLSVPNTIKLKAGTKTDVKVTVNPGKDFKGQIEIDVKASKGLIVKAQGQYLPPTMIVNVAAAKDAEGKAEVHITAMGGGKTHKAKINVEIEKAVVEPPPVDFKLKAVPPSVKLKPGEKKTVQIQAPLIKDAKGKLVVETKGGKGVNFEGPAKYEQEPNTTNFMVTLVAAKDAPPGKSEATVTATLAGKTASVKIGVEVEKVAPPEDKEKTLKLPTSPFVIKLAPGGKHEVTVHIERGKTLKGTISVELKGTKGLKVEPQKKDLGEKDKAFKFTVTATKDAPAGKGRIDVTASGDGRVAEMSYEVIVDKGGVVPPPPPPADKKLEVSGRVTLDGKALASGQVNFFPESNAFTVPIGPDGAYTVNKMVAGKNCKVSVTTASPKPDQPSVTIPEKYQSPFTSGLVLQITGNKQTFNIELKSAGKPDTKPAPNKVVISGTVLLDGKPLNQAVVHFVGPDGKDHASAPTSPNGFYSIAEKGIITTDGAYKVIEPLAAGAYQVSISPGKGVKGGGEKAVPQKYRDAKTSGLSFTAKPGTQQFDINLQGNSKPAPKEDKKGAGLSYRLELAPTAIVEVRRAA